MNEIITNRVILAIRKRPGEPVTEFAGRCDELAGLCEAAGGVVVGHYAQERQTPDKALYLGSGKIREIAEAVVAEEADLVIFDGELSPGQIRNLEDKLDCRVIDRTQLILDIFALRARSREGLLQVEIAQLQYYLPRLTGRGAAMSRLGGGIGTRGPGETKLETDRRRIRERMDRVRAELKKVRHVRTVQRARRTQNVPMVALVGYTNAGKTTLLRRWTEELGSGSVTAGNARLFDTLDPLARRVQAPVGGELVLLDTVGFVRELPHMLVDAFRATLEEVMAADLIVHVVDAGDSTDVRLQTTYAVLDELGASDKPVLTFFNKMDTVETPPVPDTRASLSIYGSAENGDNMNRLYLEVNRLLRLDAVHYHVTGPLRSDSVWQDLAKYGQVTESEQTSDGQWRLAIRLQRRLASRFLQHFGRDYPELQMMQEESVSLGEGVNVFE